MKTETIIKFLSAGTSESSKRLIGYRSAMVLLVIACGLAAAVIYQACDTNPPRPVDNGLLTSLTFIVGIVAALAQQIYRKPEDGSNDAKAAAPAPGAQP